MPLPQFTAQPENVQYHLIYICMRHYAFQFGFALGNIQARTKQIAKKAVRPKALPLPLTDEQVAWALRVQPDWVVSREWVVARAAK